MSVRGIRYVPASYIFCRRDGRILLIKRQNTGYLDGYYSVPSGHVEADELPIACAVRELNEETTLKTKREDMVFKYVVARKAVEQDHERVDFFFEAESWVGEPKIGEPEKCCEINWFRLDNLPEPLDPLLKIVLDHERSKSGPYIETSF